MSYSSSGDERVTNVLNAIDQLILALRETGDPIFGHRYNPACLRWLNEELRELGLAVKSIAREV